MRSLRFWASILISVVFLWLALRGQSLDETVKALKSADYLYVIPAVALYFLGVWVRSVRWSTLLSPIGNYSSGSLFPVVVIGYMANDVLPFRMGEVVRVHVLSQREGISKTSALGTVVVERLLDAITMLLLLAAGALLVPLTGDIKQSAVVTAVLLFIGVAVLLFIVLAPGVALRAASPALTRLPARLVGRLTAVAGGFLAGLRVVRSVRVLSSSLALSVVAWLLEAGMYWVLATAFDLPVGAPVVLLTLAVANLATLVPGAPGYVGSFEVGALLVLSGLAAVNRELATGYVLVVHLALVLPVVLLGIYYWGSHHLSLNRIRREAEVSRGSGARLEINALD